MILKIAARHSIQVLVLIAALFAAGRFSGRAILDQQIETVSPTGGFPDRYAEYMHDIRTSDFELNPSYSPNYMMTELARARRAAKSNGSILPWEERGPGNVGGRTRAIVVDVRDTSHHTWFAAATSGGIWKTVDEGASWIHVSNDIPNLAFSSLAQSLANPEIFYAGSGEGFFNGDAVSGAGVFKSVDGGMTWSQLSATASSSNFRFVNRLITSPDDVDLVVVGTREGIFRSSDGGGSWSMSYQSRAAAGILQVIADPENFSRQYATESGTGVFRSLDAGATWQLASNGLFGLGDGSINEDSRVELAIAPSNTLRLYAAVESNAGSERLFSSPNGGDIWIPVLPEPGTDDDPDWGGTQAWYNNAIAVHPFDENVVYLGGINLYRAELSGSTDIGVLTSLDEENTASFLDFVSFDSATHFGGRLKTGLSEEGAVISEDDFVSVEVRFGPGQSQKAHRFTPADGPGIPFSTYPYAGYVDVPFEVWDITNNRQLMVSFRDRLNNGVFDLIERDDQNLGREYVVVSATPYNGSLPDPQIARTGGPLSKMLYFFWPMLVSGGTWNPEDLPVSTLRINYEMVTGSARTTAPIGSSSSLHVDQHIILPVVTDAENQLFNLIVGNDGGVFRSTRQDGSWLERNNGYNTSQFYGVDKKPGEDLFVGGTQDNGTWRSPANPSAGSGWFKAFGGDGFDVAWNQGDGRELLGSAQFNDFRRSINFGNSWVSAKSGLTDIGDPNQNGGGQFISVLARSPDLPEIVFTIGKSGVWKSENFGFSWSGIAVPASNWGFGGSGKVEVSLADGSVVWAGYEMGVSLTGPGDVLGKLHVSTNRGESFSPVSTPENLASGRFSGLATHPNNPNSAFVLFSASGRPKILRTENLGQTWEDLSGFDGSSAKQSANGFPDVAVHDLLVIPQRPSEIWAGTEIGLFISRDAGSSWSIADNGLPAVSIWQMRIVDDLVVVATHGRGIWTVDLSELIALDNKNLGALPNAFQLSQNYPNPFNPSTTIRFSLSSPEHVQIIIFDALGRRVALLRDESMPPGVHEIVWDASKQASGAYLLQVVAGSARKTRLMTLLK